MPAPRIAPPPADRVALDRLTLEGSPFGRPILQCARLETQVERTAPSVRRDRARRARLVPRLIGPRPRRPRDDHHSNDQAERPNPPHASSPIEVARDDEPSRSPHSRMLEHGRSSGSDESRIRRGHGFDKGCRDPGYSLSIVHSREGRRTHTHRFWASNCVARVTSLLALELRP